MPACKYHDPCCVCPDGDPCHYEGTDPYRVTLTQQHDMASEITRLRADKAELVETIEMIIDGAAWVELSLKEQSEVNRILAKHKKD